jgi:hypothetical protein
MSDSPDHQPSFCRITFKDSDATVQSVNDPFFANIDSLQNAKSETFIVPDSLAFNQSIVISKCQFLGSPKS